MLSATFLIIHPDNQSNYGYINTSELTALQERNLNLTANTSKDVIYLNTSTSLLIEQSPGMGTMNSTPTEYFVIDGLINPTLIVKSGINLKFIVVNMDNMEHNFAITSIAPPYPYMIMGAGMMNYNYNGYFLLNTPYLRPYQGGSEYPYLQVNFSPDSSGEYWYICTYPGHAEEGMYGEIIIENN